MPANAENVSALTLRSFAKVNLYLDAGHRRDDGFHAIETIFQTVDLCDDLRFEARGDVVTLACDRPDLDTGPSNLIVRAANLLRGAAGSTRGAHIVLTKRIPIAAGLAGGSGNAAATLAGLNRLWALGFSGDRLEELALTLGSDVPYCLRGGTMTGRGRGEQLNALPALRGAWFVLAHPQIEVSTAWVYGHADLPRRPIGTQPTPQFESAIAALANRDWAACLHNAMETVVFERYPALRAIKERLLAQGCAGAVMSGSGPTVFGVAEREDEARRIAASFADLRTTVARPVDCGVA